MMLGAKYLAAGLHRLLAQLLRLWVVTFRQHYDGEILLRLQRTCVPRAENTLSSFQSASAGLSG